MPSMIEDMAARKLGRHSQRSHIYSCKRFAAFLKRSPDTATVDDIRRFQLHLVEAGLSICNRNRIITISQPRSTTSRSAEAAPHDKPGRGQAAARHDGQTQDPCHARPLLWLWFACRRDRLTGR
jgi:hypothetical protein